MIDLPDFVRYCELHKRHYTVGRVGCEECGRDGGAVNGSADGSIPSKAGAIGREGARDRERARIPQPSTAPSPRPRTNTKADSVAGNDGAGSPRRTSSTESAPTRPRPGQDVEDALWAALEAAGLTDGAERQFPFAKAYGRKWRADVGYPAARLLVECEGQVHAIKGRRIGDLERASVAAVLGYRMVRCDRKTVEDGRAVEWIRACLEAPANR